MQVQKQQINSMLFNLLKVDNAGAIYLASNYSTGPKKNYIDFVTESIIKGVLKEAFVKSE